MTFTTKLLTRAEQTGASLCVGIDPDPDKLPESVRNNKNLGESVLEFCLSIIESTSPFAAAFKLNLAFFEALGSSGHDVLSRVLDAVPAGIVTIADAKRGDIGNSARFYAKAVLEDLGFDSITVAPYMGSDSVTPFLAYEGKAAIVLARTSNPGGNDFQMLSTEGIPLYQRVAKQCLQWNLNNPVRLVSSSVQRI